ncbi:pimeloyl-ACP methyl ester carboxylesterase [Saccharothrix ecbatanensis]|uniref:Pimeloyl-ACP methyl ester carboxylesterase n=1 Tax=Saccharothrix ecbatanensis TaxID=1105145 RepID=A0A7W9HJ78_9PSEU|nr:alpha/beta hydrolase [Saccharothrix ecbatanensis]MBB5803001.1 pimeloyl-ACP methyl ester carboxylesterase [Saccharothrix ecbatanensis]
MPEIELTAGVIEYDDTGGPGPVVVLLHGVLMDGSLWREVVADLRGEFRCVVPTLPLGSHRHPMNADADLSLRGIAGILAEFLDRVDLRDVTLVGNDTGGALAQILVADNPGRVAKLALIACEAFDNFPPGLPGKMSAVAGKMPGGMWMAAQQLRMAPMRRLPITYGWMAKRPIPGDVIDSWMRSARSSRPIRRDFARFLKSGDPRQELTEAARGLPAFTGPALVVWAEQDRIMPAEHGRELARLLPGSEFVEVPDSYTLVPLDQPGRVGELVRAFAHGKRADDSA